MSGPAPVQTDSAHGAGQFIKKWGGSMSHAGYRKTNIIIKTLGLRAQAKIKECLSDSIIMTIAKYTGYNRKYLL